MSSTHLLPACQSWLLEKVVFIIKVPALVVDLEPRLHVLCQGAVAHHEYLAEKKVENGLKGEILRKSTFRPPFAQQRRGNAVWKTKAPCSFWGET